MKQDFPATQRNREPILAELRKLLPDTGLVLEVAAGSGQHAAFFAAALPHLTWQPTDHDADLRASQAAWTQDLPNVREPLHLDVLDGDWPLERADAIYCANMIHIAPWECCEGLMRCAGELLASGAPLFLYGPFMREAAHTAPSNAAFDASLKSRDPRWGVRPLEAVTECAETNGLAREAVIEMPANNLSVIFRR